MRHSLILDRDAEISRLKLAAAQVAGGESALVVIEGSPGIGKTALLAELAEISGRAGLRTLRARGTVIEQDLAWSVVRQLLVDAVADAHAGERVELLSGAARLARRVLGLADDSGEALEVSGALHGLYWLTLNLADQQPLLLSVDDVQWADRQSLTYLNYLANRLDGGPILLAVAIRTGEPDELAEGLEMLRTARSSVSLRPADLTEASTAQLVRHLIPVRADARVCASVYAAAHGNPFLVHELCRELAQIDPPEVEPTIERLATAVPQSVTENVLARLRRLPESARSIAVSVATLGQGATLTRLAQLAGLELDATAEAVALLLRGDILLERGQALEFVHPLVREAIYSSMPAPQRGVLHAKAARQLAEERAEPAAVAAQLLRSPPAAERWRIEVLRAAARAAREAGAPASASRHLQRALAESLPEDQNKDLLLELGISELQHDPAASIEHLSRARALAASPPEAAQLALALAQAHAVLSDFPSALRVLGEAVAVLDHQQPTLRRRLESSRLTFARWDYGSQELRRELFTALRVRADAGDELDASERANMAHELAAMGENRDQAVRHATAALERITSVRGPEEITLVQLSSVLVLADHPGKADAVLSEALARAEARGSSVEASMALTLASYCALRQGNLVQALGHGQASLELAPGVWNRGAIAWMVEALAERAEHDEAERLLVAHGLAQSNGVGDPGQPLGYGHAALLHHRGRARALGSQHELALADLLIVGQLSEVWGITNPAVTTWRSSAARSLLALGRGDEGAAMVQEELPLARRWGAPTAIGVALCVAGECDPGSHGTALLRESVEVLSKSPAQVDRARALVSLGARLRRERHNLEARELLRQGLDLAHHCGALLLSARARDELVAAGGRPRREALRGRSALTGRELRVAELAAGGMTNRQIAQTLFLSSRTVEHHLRAAYRKLGIASREELSAALDVAPRRSP